MDALNSQLVDYKKTVFDKKAELDYILPKYLDKYVQIRDGWQEINRIFKDKLSDFKPQIMVYGIYNAGKSSIINALMGQECARVEDVPTTDQVDLYPWNGYEIADTPGINAPIEHEQVTNQQLKQTDIVLFVMSTNGAFDYAYNYERMHEIIDANKDVIIVLNDKKGYMGKSQEQESELEKIKVKIVENMHRVGINKNIADVEGKYKIIVVNANRALKGRREKSEKWLELSNIAELEKTMLRELKHTDSFRILGNALLEIEKNLRGIVNNMQDNEGKKEIREINKFLLGIREQKLNLENEMHSYVKSRTSRLKISLPDMIWSKRDDENAIQQVIRGQIEEAAKDIQNELIRQFEKVSDIIAQNIEAMMENLQCIDMDIDAQLSGEVRFQSIDNDFSEQTLETSMSAKKRKEKITELMAVAKNIYDIYTSKNIERVGMGIITEQVPIKLIEQIGVSFLGKVAAEKVVAFIPYVGPIIMGLFILRDLFGDDGEGNRMRQQAEAKNEYERKKMEAEMEARQQIRQNCDSLASDVAEKINQSVDENIFAIMGNIENEFKKQAEDAKLSVDDLSASTAKINSIIDEFQSIRLSIS